MLDLAESDLGALDAHSRGEHGAYGTLGAMGEMATRRIAASGVPWQARWGPQSGEASYYGTSRRGDHRGDGFAWHVMANGEPMNPDAYIAAHQHLPLGSKVRVHRGPLSVEVTIADRGPYAGNRILDLSPRAAEELGIVQAGHGRVQLEVLSLG